MPVREFNDASGRKWLAWDIKPEAIHPATRAEDYLADCFVTGWIVFETVSGDEKRRLCPWPVQWATSTEAQLRDLLDRAEKIPRLKLDAERQSVGAGPGRDVEVEVPSEQNKLDVTDLHVVRTFRYPGGRL